MHQKTRNLIALGAVFMNIIIASACTINIVLGLIDSSDLLIRKIGLSALILILLVVHYIPVIWIIAHKIDLEKIGEDSVTDYSKAGESGSDTTGTPEKDNKNQHADLEKEESMFMMDHINK